MARGDKTKLRRRPSGIDVLWLLFESETAHKFCSNAQPKMSRLVGERVTIKADGSV